MTISFDEYVRYDGLGLAELVRRGEVQQRELLDVAIRRADEANPKLNAIVRRCDERARERAAQPAASQARFSGVPFLVKSLFQEIAGLPSCGGSRALGKAPAQASADVTRRWEAEGLLIFGMTNTPEFGAKNVTEPLAHGPTRNPWDLARTTGGSSGGSAAAVAAGIVPVAGGNDGGGSIRIPAAACGLLGLKPGRGRISMGPAVGEALNGCAVQGVLSRSVRDSAAMLDVLQGPEPHAPYPMPHPARSYLDAIRAPLRRLKIGFSTASPIGMPVHPDAVDAVHDAARLLESLGHHVEEGGPGIDGNQLAQDFLIPWFCFVAATVDEIRRNNGAVRRDFEPDTLAMADAGRSVSASELLQIQGRWQTYVTALARFHAQYDLWLSPVLSEPALPIGHMKTPQYLHLANDIVSRVGLAGALRKTATFQTNILKNLAWTPFTQLANITGRPAVSVPLYWNRQGLPLGVQFLAPLDGEALLLQLAAELEQARPWFDKRPQI
ncbi:amidase [Noviherbaspirillum sp.]|uniref:amidase n=1 Tax=Noviherbaspirillum sp. TaxID=1926288 RepID=UPI002D7379D4|nr:amidase family protein [Noviherbaspirillum sp.]HZW21396.1 amidase family protein [Noviherbaspirillum sp.]